MVHAIVPSEQEQQRLVFRHCGDCLFEFVHRFDWGSVDLKNHVSLTDSGLRSRAVGPHAKPR